MIPGTRLLCLKKQPFRGGVIYRVYGLRLGSNFVVRLASDKNFYLRLTAEKLHVFAIFNDKYLQPYGCSDTNVTATVNCTNPKTETLREIIGIQIDFLLFC